MNENKVNVIKEPEKDIPIVGEEDVIICGGGPAGICAALSSARMGRKTLLIEHYGFLGGANTAAGVSAIGGWQFERDGRPLIAGIPLEIMVKLAQIGGASPREVDYIRTKKEGEEIDVVLDDRLKGSGCYWVHTHPEYMKLLLDEMMEEAGVTILYHTDAVAPIMKGKKIKGIIVENKSGRQAFLSKIVVDCTGDGDVAARAGAMCREGREKDGAIQPMTTMFLIANAAFKQKGYDDASKLSLQENRMESAVKLARDIGDISINPNDILCSKPPIDHRHETTRAVNFTRIQGMNGTDSHELTSAEIIGRKQVFEAVKFIKKYALGCKDAYLVSIPTQIGIRESRRIIGEYYLTENDVINAAKFSDGIGRSIYRIDIHNPNEISKPSVLNLLGEPYDIPYRCLVPLKIDNLLVAGRCVSGDEVALASFRIMATCMLMGQAAGTAAALCITEKLTPRQIDVTLLRNQLKANGVNLGR